MNDDRPSRYYFPFVKRRSNWKGSAIKLAIFGNKYAIGNESARERERAREREWQKPKNNNRKSSDTNFWVIMSTSLKCDTTTISTKQPKQQKKVWTDFGSGKNNEMEATVVTNSSSSLPLLWTLDVSLNYYAMSMAEHIRPHFGPCILCVKHPFPIFLPPCSLFVLFFLFVVVCLLTFLQDSICLFTCV